MENLLNPKKPNQKRYALLWLLCLAGWLGLSSQATAQTTIITTAGTGFDAANGLSGNSFITFVVENTNTYDVILTGVDNFWKTGNNGTVPSLWYTSTSLSGPISSPGISTPTWTNIATGTSLAVTANGFLPSFTNLNFVIPAGAQYRFALVSTTGISYSGSGAGTPSPNTFTTAGVTLKVHDAKIAGSDVGYSGAFPTSTNSPRAFTGRIHFQPATPCVAPPTGGQATASSAIVCPNTNFQLGLTGASGGQGMTYQWQSSPNGTTGWTNVTGATNANVTVTQTATSFYRAQLTCSGQTATSATVQVTSNSTPTTGTFTINKNAAASATNFTSFAAAIASIECGGVNGPVTFNVVANTGPYNEQVVLPVIPGASATNTVTFNGNGNTISTTPSGTNAGIITLNGADFVTFNNLVLTLPATATTGWGVQLMNQADNNTISNCTINLPLAATSSNVNGIGFGTTISTAANNGNNNTFSNNTIFGGYYAIRINGPTGTVGATGNQIINNTITDNYIYNIYLSNTESTLIEGNTISRPTRTSITTFYGVFMTGTSKNNVISKNRIHNAFGGTASTTSAAYLLYFSSTDAPVGSENIIKNNLFYNINTNGTIYGFYNIGSDGAYFYHNTMDLSHASNTGTVRGIFQTTAATNIRIQNNIFTIGGGASGTKHALYFGTTTSAITSNRNVFNVTGAASVGSWGTANQATLAAWRTASSQDANSVAANPLYVDLAAGNLRPTNVAVNDLGTALTPPVTDDFTGATRSTTSPDPGAYEFTVSANDVGVTAITGAASGCGLTAAQSITITVKNFGSAPQSNIPVNFLVNGTIIGTGTIPGPLAPNATVTHTFTTTANLSAPGPYTIVANTLMTGDADPSNNTFTLNVSNSLIPTLPINLDFETPATGLGAVQVVTNSLSTVTQAAGGSSTLTPPAGSTQGMIMAGITSANWQTPVGVIDPWTNNGNQFSAVYMCINPSGGAASDSLWLTFDLKQLFKTANSNTNFRVTVNGQQVGPTYRPPFDPANPSTPIVWRRIRVDLTPYKNMTNVQIGLESSVKEEFANGNGTANLVDNIRVVRRIVSGTRSDILASQLKVHPNPSNGIFNVTAPKGNYTVEVTDMTGRTILKQTVNGTATQLNLKDAAKGIYLMKITSEGNVAAKRLVVE